MNRVYTHVLIISFLIICAPRVTFSQCNCSVGVPASPITYYQSFGPTNAAATNLTFPQFNPSVGTLACMSVWDTASGVTATTALNRDLFDSVTYAFLLSLTPSLTGPGGLNISQSYSKTYGPTTLAPLGRPGDTVTYGPDTIFNNVAGNKTNVSNTAPYLGTGNVTFSFGISGGVLTTEGGSSYTAGPTTNYWGAVRLTYFWCPASALSVNITDFTVTPQENVLLLQWLTQQQQPNTQYEIQISQDGKNFYDLGEAEGDASATGAVAKYQYQYHPDPAYVGQLYFRIRQTDPSGKVTVSMVLVVDPRESGSAGAVSYQTFPNPATNSLQIRFNGSQSGRFLLQLIGTSGQVVKEQLVTLAGSSQIRMDLSPHPVPGLYFLRTTDQTHNRSYVTKVFVQ
jgi:type IX secretion system substrate protein